MLRVRERMAIICLCLGVLWGCGNRQNVPEDRDETVTGSFSDEGAETEQAREETAMDAKRMTREYIIEKGLFTEEELAGVNVEAILERYKWVEGDENRRTWRTMFEVEIQEQRTAAGLTETIDYSYLSELETRENGLSREELGTVKTVAFQYNSGTSFETVILDREKSRMYLGEACDLLAADMAPPVSRELDTEVWDSCMALLETCDVPNWKKHYQGVSEEGTTGHFWWQLTLELEDGKACSYSGNGVMGENAPKQYGELQQGLHDLFGAD